MKGEIAYLPWAPSLLALLLATNLASAYYDPGPQRWINRDPYGEIGGRNLYVASRNNCVRFVDPLGGSAAAFPSRPPEEPPVITPPRPPSLPPAIPPPGPIFPREPSSGDKNKAQVSSCSGNAPPVHPARPPRPCYTPGATTPSMPSKRTETKQCPCTGTVTVSCTEHNECVFWSMGLNGQTQYNWETRYDCPCPEYKL